MKVLFLKILIIAQLFSITLFAKTNDNFDELRALDRIIKGVKKTNSYSKIQELRNIYEENLKNTFLKDSDLKIYSVQRKRSCHIYSKNNQLVHDEIINTLDIAVSELNSGSDKFRYAQARLELLAGLSYQLALVALANAEGGVRGFGTVKEKCILQKNERVKWKKSVIARENSLNKLMVSLFGVRKMTEVFELSNFLASKMVYNAERNLKLAIGGLALSAVTIPITSIYLSSVGVAALSNLGINVSLGTLKGIKIAGILLGVGSGAYVGYSRPDLFFDIPEEIIMDDMEKLYRTIVQIVESDFDNPEVYFENVLQQERGYSKIYKKIMLDNGPKYRETISKCIKENEPKEYCRDNWLSFAL